MHTLLGSMVIAAMDNNNGADAVAASQVGMKVTKLALQNGKANPFCAQVLQTLNNVDASANKVGGAAVDATLILAISGIGDAGPAQVAAIVAGGAQATTVLASLGKGLATGDYRQFAVRALTAGGGSVLANSKIVKSLGTGADNPINKIGDFLNSLAPEPQCPRK